MCQHASSIAAAMHRLLPTHPQVTESLFRREHHVGSSVFEAALVSNYAVTVAECGESYTTRPAQGPICGVLYWSCKSRPLGLAFIPAALVNGGHGLHTRHLPLVFASPR